LNGQPHLFLASPPPRHRTATATPPRVISHDSNEISLYFANPALHLPFTAPLPPHSVPRMAFGKLRARLRISSPRAVRSLNWEETVMKKRERARERVGGKDEGEGGEWGCFVFRCVEPNIGLQILSARGAHAAPSFCLSLSHFALPLSVSVPLSISFRPKKPDAARRRAWPVAVGPYAKQPTIPEFGALIGTDSEHARASAIARGLAG